MPRFVILYHQLPDGHQRGSHWDLMLETSQVLRTWALAASPRPDAEIAATSLPDHRLAYLDYEGPVSRDRGTVTRWDEGQCQLLTLTESRCEVRLDGRRLACHVLLRQRSEGAEHWTATFGANQLESPGDPPAECS